LKSIRRITTRKIIQKRKNAQSKTGQDHLRICRKNRDDSNSNGMNPINMNVGQEKRSTIAGYMKGDRYRYRNTQRLNHKDTQSKNRDCPPFIGIEILNALRNRIHLRRISKY